MCVHVYKVRGESFLASCHSLMRPVKLYKREARVRGRERPGASENQAIQLATVACSQRRSYGKSTWI